MLSLEKTINKVLSNDEEKNLFLGQILFDRLGDIFPNENKEEKDLSKYLIYGLCLDVLSADGLSLDKEISYLNDITGVSFSKDEISEKFSNLTSQKKEILATLKEYKEEIYDDFLLLLILVAASDGEISPLEKEALQRFIAYREGKI